MPIRRRPRGALGSAMGSLEILSSEAPTPTYSETSSRGSAGVSPATRPRRAISLPERRTQTAPVTPGGEAVWGPSSEAWGRSPSVASRASRVSALSAGEVQRLRTELRRGIDFDPGEGTVKLTREDIEALKDPATLEFLAQTPGIAKYADGWRHCSVFVTAVRPDGTPEAATIDDDIIHLPVDVPHGKEGGARVRSFLDHEEEPLSDEDDATTIATSEAGSSAEQKPHPPRVPSFMRGTASTAARRRDLMREKEQGLERRAERGAMLAERAERAENRVVLAPSGQRAPVRRVKERAPQAPPAPTTRFTAEEEARLDAILADETKYSAPDFDALPGEGYRPFDADAEKEAQINDALRRLRPGMDWDRLLLPPVPKSTSVAGSKKAPKREPLREVDPEERRRQELVERARGEALCLREPHPEDWIAEMREERRAKAELGSLNEKLNELYDGKADEEEQVRLDREYDEGEAYRRRLPNNTLEALLREGAEEQGREWEPPEQDGMDRGGVSIERSLSPPPLPAPDLFSGDTEDQPADPEDLFAPRPPTPPTYELGCVVRAAALVAIASAACPVTSPKQSAFMRGDWDSLLKPDQIGELQRERLSAISPFPHPSSNAPTPRE
eukprot:Hpha_TRINITY_DN3568_c0_g1::TRINITY_DN3568_c0_g1_i1::g.25764::m.25764